jgi:hypothetical protein
VKGVLTAGGKCVAPLEGLFSRQKAMQGSILKDENVESDFNADVGRSQKGAKEDLFLGVALNSRIILRWGGNTVLFSTFLTI